jgi:hypothetical protein
MARYVKISEVLKHVLHQRTFDDFLSLADLAPPRSPIPGQS